MKYFSAILLIGFTVLCLAQPAAAFPREHFTIHPVELAPEAAITQEELAAWAATSSSFADTEQELMDAFKRALEDFGPGGEGWLRMNQSDWVKRRQANALKYYGPKGEAAYIAFLTQEAGKRVAWLEQLAEKGKVVFAHNYLYQQSGLEGMIILYYRKQGIEFELYTKNLETGATCEDYGEGTSNDGKIRYQNLTVEFLELGKSLELAAPSEAPICQDGGRFTGTYLLIK